MCLFRLFQSCHRHYESKSIFLRNRWEKTLQCMFICIYHYRLYIVYCKNCWKKPIRKGGITIAEANHCMTRVNLKCFHPIFSLNPIRQVAGGDTVDPSVSQSIFQSSFFPFFIFIFFKRSAERLLNHCTEPSSKIFVDIIRTLCKDVHITRKFRFLNFLGILTLLFQNVGRLLIAELLNLSVHLLN